MFYHLSRALYGARGWIPSRTAPLRGAVLEKNKKFLPPNQLPLRGN
jgi:hypothetical protein